MPPIFPPTTSLWKESVATPADLPATGAPGETRKVLDDGDGKPAQYVYDPEDGWLKDADPDGVGSGGGAVDSFNGRTGVVTAQAGDYTATQVGALADTLKQATITVITRSLTTGTSQPLSLADALFTGLAAAGSVAGTGTVGIVAASFASAGAETGTGANQGGLGSAAAADQPYNATDFAGQNRVVCELLRADGDEIILSDVLSAPAAADASARVYGYLSYRSDLAADQKWRLWFYYRRAADGLDTPFTPDISLNNVTLHAPQVVLVKDLPVRHGLAAPTVASQAAAAVGMEAIGTSELAAGAVTYAKMQHVSATDRILGRSTAGAGVVEEIACTAAGRALIDDANAAAQRTTLSAARALHSAAAAPTVTDDTNAGYEVGQYWLDTAGKAVYIATDVTAGAAVWQRISGANLQVFTSSGTYTKPAGCSRVVVIAIGGGGGGGSGRRGAAGVTRAGGSGGAGGGWAYDALPASVVGSTETVTVGAGGTGGAAPGSDNSNGAVGTSGGASTFGSLVRASGGANGRGGTTTATTAAGSGAQGGGSGGTGTNGVGSTGDPGITGGAGGGGGGGVTSGNNHDAGGTGGSSGYISGGGGGTGGAAGGTAGTAGTAVTANRPQSGGGGGGGGGNNAGGGGAGGNGALYGAGGGGAGGTTNGATGGNGGNGADGIVLVWSD
jgi:hypothetical protein